MYGRPLYEAALLKILGHQTRTYNYTSSNPPQTTMWNAILGMNNASVFAMSKGQLANAITCLRKTLELLAAVWDNYRTDIRQKIERQPDAASLISVAPFANDSQQNISSSSLSAFVYDCGFIISATPTNNLSHSELDILHEAAMLCLSATVIYNTALVYHRMALSAQDNRNLINFAAAGYTQAIIISHMEIQKQEMGSYWNKESKAIIAIAVASNNNLGQLYFDLMNDHHRGRR